MPPTEYDDLAKKAAAKIDTEYYCEFFGDKPFQPGVGYLGRQRWLAAIVRDAYAEQAAELDDLLWFLRHEYERENPDLPVPDFLVMAKSLREAVKAAEKEGDK